MKILLLRPKPDPRTIGLQHVMVVEPLELLYAGAVLLPRHTVVLYDMILEKASLEAILDKEKPDLVAMTGYIAHVGVLLDYGARIRRHLGAGVIIAVGGVHAEVVPEDFLPGDFDHILAANGLEVLKAIADGVISKDAKGPVIHRGPKHFGEPPLPARHLADRYRKHYYYMFHRPCALVKSSYGCPYRCAFCFCKAITDGQYVQRPIEAVVAEIAQLPEREIYIVDDDFLFDARRLERFCDLLESQGLDKRFLVYGRADFIATHPELMKRLKAVGLRAVIVGLESALDSELDSYNKGSHVATSKEALALLRALKIDCYGTFIIGLDWSVSDFKALGRFIYQESLQFVNLQPLTPLPGTEVFDSYAHRLTVPRTAYHLYDMAHAVMAPTQMSLRRFYFEIVKRYYLTTLRPKHVVGALLRYPLRENISLLVGANRVMLQYLSRIIKGTEPL